MVDLEDKELKPEILEAVRRASRDGRISCTEAHRVAAELGVEPRLVGAAANALKIKIYACELGCFK